MENGKVQGVVKWFNDQKGFGFISFDGNDAFVHYSEIVGNGHRKLNEGDVVEFEAVRALCSVTYGFCALFALCLLG